MAGAERQVVREGVPFRKNTVGHGEGKQGVVYERPETEPHRTTPPGSWLRLGRGSENLERDEELGGRIWLE